MIQKILILFATLCGPALAQAPDTLTMAVPTIPETRGNPYSNAGLPFGLTNQILFDPLAVLDDNGMMTSWLAASWQQHDGGWTLKIRDGITFSNGEMLDAEAVASALNYILKPTNAADAVGWQSFRESVVEINATDPRTVEIVTRKPNPIMMHHIMRVLVPAPGAWKTMGREGFAQAPVGTGPYVLKQWRSGRASFAASPTTWRPPKIAKIEIVQVIDHAARLQSVLSGAADVALQLPAEIAADTLEEIGGTLYARTVPSISQIQFVTKRLGPLQDVRVRRAINFAVDRELLTRTFHRGAVQPASQMAHEQQVGFDPTLKAYPYDPEAARRLLAEAGYEKGFTFTMSLVADGGGSVDVMQQIASDLRRVGITMQIRPFTISTMMARLASGDWQEDAFATGLSGYDPVNGAVVRSCLWPNPHHCDEGAVPLINAARAAATEDEYAAAVRRLLRYEWENPSGLMMYRNPAFDGLSPRVADYRVRNDFMLLDEIKLRGSR